MIVDEMRYHENATDVLFRVTLLEKGPQWVAAQDVFDGMNNVEPNQVCPSDKRASIATTDTGRLLIDQRIHVVSNATLHEEDQSGEREGSS